MRHFIRVIALFVQIKTLQSLGKELNGHRCEKTCLREFANNTGADQPTHPCSLISAFIIPFLESTECKLPIAEVSIFYLVSVAEDAGLKLALSETPKTDFVATHPN